MNDFAERLNQLSPQQRALLVRRMQERVRSRPPAVSIERRENLAEYPLSFAQQRMWFLEQMQSEVALYNITTTIEIRRLQDAAGMCSALSDCLSEITRRHEVLRAAFDFVDGQLVQRIHPLVPVEVPYTDLRQLASAERERTAQTIVRAEMQRRFEMSTDLLLRVRLLQLEPARYLLVLTVHHSVFDAWSVGLLVEEIETIFAAMLAGEPITRPPLAIQYADFAAWQRQSLQGALLEQQLGYWQQQLAGPLPVLDLPTDRPRPPVRTLNGAQQAFTVPAAVSAQLRSISQDHAATLFMTLLAAWSVLLHIYSRQDDLLIGTPIANRHHKALEQLIGCFVNTLVLRVTFDSSLAFVDLLRQVRQTALDAYAHQDLPFEVLVDALQVERDVSRTPLFQVLFALQNTPLHGGPVGLSMLSEIHSPAKFDLTLTMSEADASLRGVLEYNTDLFDASTIERMLGHFLTLLAAIGQRPESTIDALTVLSPVERHRLLFEWNATARPFSDSVCIQQLFEAQVVAYGERTAVVAGDQALDYRSLNAQANQLAHQLIALGAGPGMRIGILCARSLEQIVGLLGVLKAGAAYVPLDPAYPAERQAAMLADADISVLLTQSRLLDHVQTSLARPDMRVICLDQRDALPAAPAANPACRASPDAVAYVIYTSGSTGQPKGVQLRHRGLCNLVQEQIGWFGLSPDSRVLQMASFSFDASVSEIFTTLIAGAALYLPPDGTHGTLDVLDLLDRYQITTVTLSPALLAALPDAELPALETIIAAGEHCSAEIVRRWGRGRRFINAYGPTEATVCATMMRCDPELPDDPPIGRPIGNVHVYILNRNLQPVPIGVPGEIYIGGAGVALGYLNRPTLNAAKFLPNPFGSGQLYRTGDVGRYRPDGTIAYLGRLDDQVKVRGFRIELGEVEHALAQQPGVAGAVVVAQPDPVAGLRLVGYITALAHDHVAADALIADALNGLRQQLPSYMLPAALVVVPEFPMTPNNKLDRRALALRPLELRSLSSGLRRAPATELEQQIASVWAQVLQQPEIGTSDNFFDIGGSSISMIKVLSLLKPLLQRDLSISTLFRFPTVSALAQHLHGGAADQARTLQAMQGHGQRQRAALLQQKRRVKR